MPESRGQTGLERDEALRGDMKPPWLRGVVERTVLEAFIFREVFSQMSNAHIRVDRLATIKHSRFRFGAVSPIGVLVGEFGSTKACPKRNPGANNRSN